MAIALVRSYPIRSHLILALVFILVFIQRESAFVFQVQVGSALYQSLKPFQLELLPGVDGLAFHKLPKGYLLPSEGRIYFEESWQQGELLNGLFEKQIIAKPVTGQPLLSYFVKPPALRFVIDDNIRAVDFFSKHKGKQPVIDFDLQSTSM